MHYKRGFLSVLCYNLNNMRLFTVIEPMYLSLKKNYLIVMPLVFIMIFSRFITVIPNFTPLISLILFIPLVLKDKKLAMILIIIAQLFADFFIGFYDTMLFVYGTYILVALFAFKYMIAINFYKVLSSSVAASIVFYITTNFGVWFAMDLYPATTSGLIACYIAGIPFLKSMTLSTVIFSTTLFVLFKVVKKLRPDFTYQNN